VEEWVRLNRSAAAVSVCESIKEADKRIAACCDDPGSGMTRHANAGYEIPTNA
jgi:urocanate hydratase